MTSQSLLVLVLSVFVLLFVGTESATCPANGITCYPSDCCAQYQHCQGTTFFPPQDTPTGTVCKAGQLVPIAECTETCAPVTPKPTTRPPAAVQTRPTSAPTTSAPATSAPTSAPFSAAAAAARPAATARPTSAPATARPTSQATARPTSKATARPTSQATARPTSKATPRPPSQATARPTSAPATARPTSAPVTTAPVTTAPNNGSAMPAYCTYHNYVSTDSLTSVACSDGSNGLMTTKGYNNLVPMFPYVTAASFATWNSPTCGSCVKLTNTANGKSVFLTVIDQCGASVPSGFNTHFDIAPAAFTELFSTAGVAAGHGSANWQLVATSYCQGNN